MSFRLFIYYCALCGGWAAYLAWALVWGTEVGPGGRHQPSSPELSSALIAGILGLLVAAAVGAVDAVLNASGFQRVVRALLCLVIGFVGGLFGGLIGEFLHTRLNLPLAIGWVLVGVAVGVSIGVFDLLRALLSREQLGRAVRKIVNGAIGGFVGGLVGGVPFGFLLTAESLPRSGLAIGLVILGLCIGLLIGLAQVILKEAWVRVEAGFRAGRELMLSREETTIGRAEGSDILLLGDNTIERSHARIVRKNNRYLLEDADTAGGTYLNDELIDRPTPLRSGDTIRVGGSILRFGERATRAR
jgi:hypothetical protein